MSWNNRNSFGLRVGATAYKWKQQSARRKAAIIRANATPHTPLCCWVVTDDGHMRECGAPAIARHNANGKLFYCAAHEIKQSYRLPTSELPK